MNSTTTEVPSFPVSYFVGSGIAGLAGLGALVCLIMVLIPLFKDKGPGLGILGIFCGIFAYVWGWMNVKKHNLKTIMMIWTACIVVATIGYGIATAAIMKTVVNDPAFQMPAGYEETPVNPPGGY